MLAFDAATLYLLLLHCPPAAMMLFFAAFARARQAITPFAATAVSFRQHGLPPISPYATDVSDDIFAT